MKLSMRPYRNEEDYWRIRAFLREVYLLNGRISRSWPVARLDYWRWHCIQNCEMCAPVASVTFLWETEDGQLAAVLNPEVSGDVFLQVHPAARSPELEAEMLEVAEAQLSVPAEDRRRKLLVWAAADDALRPSLLEARGYAKGQAVEHQHIRELDRSPIAPAKLPPGYSVRALRGPEELPARSWLSWLAFHPDEPDEAYEGWEWYQNIQRHPLYRRDLDIVAVAPDGGLAAFCTVWFDDVTRSAYFEPVGAAPAHHRRGLARAVMVEGLRRLQQMGATQATVSGMAPGANALYDQVIGPAGLVLERWHKEW